MDRKRVLEGPAASTYRQLTQLHEVLHGQFRQQLDRSLPFNDEVFDRWERARLLGCGEGSSIYDSSYVFGDVRVGQNVWIGPFTVIDGSGGLEIGDGCTIAVGVQVYSHDNIKRTLSGGSLPIEREPTTIGANTYVGPNSIIQKGTTIGSHCVIGAGTFVNRDLPDNSIAVGTPARIVGHTRIDAGGVEFIYSSEK